MKIATFKENLDKDDTGFPKKFKNMVIGSVMLTLVFGFLMVYSFSLDGKSEQTKKKVDEYTAFINQYHEEERAYLAKNILSRPMRRDEINLIQMTLIQKMNQYKLNVISLNAAAQPANPNPQNQAANQNQGQQPEIVSGIDYDAAVTGTWEACMRYLHDLKNEPVLINLRSVRMEAQPNNDLIKLTFKYKIYTE